MTIILSLILAVPAYVLWDSNRLGSFLCIGAIVLLLFAGFTVRQDAKAYVNRREYWAMSGKDRARAMRRWEEEAELEELEEDEW